MSHFWGSYPTAFLTGYVLGIRPITPGYKTFLFFPLSGFNTTWVHGRVPTPNGIMYAAWGYGSDEKMSMEITIPQGLKCTIVPPFTESYTLDGKSGLFGNSIVSGGGKVIIIQD